MKPPLAHHASPHTLDAQSFLAVQFFHLPVKRCYSVNTIYSLELASQPLASCLRLLPLVILCGTSTRVPKNTPYRGRSPQSLENSKAARPLTVPNSTLGASWWCVGEKPWLFRQAHHQPYPVSLPVAVPPRGRNQSQCIEFCYVYGMVECLERACLYNNRGGGWANGGQWANCGSYQDFLWLLTTYNTIRSKQCHIGLLDQPPGSARECKAPLA